MGILDVLLDADNQQLIMQVAKSVGMDEADVQQVVNQVVPVISQGIKQNIGQSNQASGVLNSLSSGKYQHYLEQPDALASTAARDDGNAVLGDVFGSKDVSRQVASQVAERTNVDSSLVKQLLPIAATFIMGSISQKVVNTNQMQSGTDDNDIMSMVSSMLDSDNDGDVTDDLLDLAKKFF